MNGKVSIDTAVKALLGDILEQAEPITGPHSDEPDEYVIPGNLYERIGAYYAEKFTKKGGK